MIPSHKLDWRLQVLLVIFFLIILSAVLFFTSGFGQDTQPPEIIESRGNFTVTAGELASIWLNFSDNVKVTHATLFYRSEAAVSWQNTSILNKTIDLYIPSDTTDNWVYYLTVDDDAHNGPVGDPSIDGSTYYTIIILENNTNNDGDWDETRYILVEEGTAGWCSNCPKVATLIHEAYTKQTIPFYYVSLVDDENVEASSRLNDDLSIYGFPTVYIDGGYSVIMGALDDFASVFKNKLQQAQERNAPKLRINLTSRWNETRKELNNTVTIENKDASTYSGTIKIYITEINSRWADYNAEAYSYALIDYGLEQTITVQPNGMKSFTKLWNAQSAGFPDIVKENIFVIAAVFTDTSEKRYANPDEGESPFNAYFCDAAMGTRVAEGTLPPTIGIYAPREYSHYIFGSAAHNKLLQFTYILGRMVVNVTIEGGSDIDKVEFLVSGRFRSFTETDTDPPYEWTWDRFSIGKYTVTAKVYDSQGRTDTDSIEVLAFIL